MRTDCGLALLVVALLAGCGSVAENDAALMRGTDIGGAAGAAAELSPDAGGAGGMAVDAGTGGMTGAGGAVVISGAGGASTGGAPGAGGVTGAGGAGTGGISGAGGAPASYTCADLLACCNSLSGTLRQQCLSLYNGGNTTTGSTCGSLLVMIKANGSCD